MFELPSRQRPSAVHDSMPAIAYAPERIRLAYTLTGLARGAEPVQQWFDRRLSLLEASWSEHVYDYDSLVEICQSMWRVPPVPKSRFEAFAANVTTALAKDAASPEAINALASMVSWNEEFSGHADPAAARAAVSERFEEFAEDFTESDFDSPGEIEAMIGSFRAAEDVLGIDFSSTVDYLQNLADEWPPERDDDDDDDDRRAASSSEPGIGGNDIDALFATLVE